MVEKKFKVKIVDVKTEGIKLLVVADFGFGWKEETMTLEDGTTKTYYNGYIERETIELPFLMTAEQIKAYLETYWSNKYGSLDTYYSTLNSLESLKGLEI